MKNAELVEAVADFASELLAGLECETAISLTAEEYGLNPALLDRKFREAHGDPVTYRQRRHAASEATLAWCRRVVQVLTTEYRSHWIGAPFRLESTHYLFGGIFGDGSEFRAVRLSDGVVVTLSWFAHAEAVLPQIDRAA